MRPATLLAVSGAVLVGGLALSYAGTQAATAGLETGAGVLGTGEALTVAADLDPAVSQRGVYAVRDVGGGGVDIVVRIAGPGGSAVLAGGGAAHHGVGSIEERFAISGAGEHALTVENAGGGAAEVIAAIGYLPGDEVLVYASAGSYVIIAGMVALAATVAVYAVRRARPS
ncbi:MAG: hypothetical protein OXD41_04980 [Thaumarchaeota archaeon]|nr:hypothetical protein [Nitrososphaerota archaeon]MDD9843757.1 hypothetical protein [Nitrososphaerota archaeon]